jgi:hypothetical protein
MTEETIDFNGKKYLDKYPEIYSLLCASFHQDWMYDYPDWESVIDAYYRTSNNKQIEDELSLLIQQHTEEQLKDYFRWTSTGISIECEEGYTYKSWLKAVMSRIKSYKKT